MCGILGAVGGKEISEEDRFKAALRLLIHRGPDEEGMLFDADFYFGCQRLKIIALESGSQPVSNEDKNIWVVFNGEIYNYKSLRKNLEAKGHRFNSNSDTEVIVHLYEDDGVASFNSLEGMFAFAIYDKRTKRCILSRDRFGIKPLFYALNKGRLIFASEISPILSLLNQKPPISFEALNLYFWLDYIPSPYTIYKDINSLLPGHYLIFTNSSVKSEKYYQLKIKNLSKKELADSEIILKENIKESLVKHLVSDVEVGLFLSGGIDSSILAYEMHRELKKFKTFTLGFDDSAYDESHYARIVSKKFNTDYKHKYLNQNNYIELLESLVPFMEQPFSDHSLLPTYMISNLASEYVKVVISGDGGDEIFLGYQTYIAHRIYNLYKVIPEKIREYFLKSVLLFLPRSDRYFSLDFCLQRLARSQSSEDIKRHVAWMESFGGEREKLLFKPAYKAVEDKYIDLIKNNFLTQGDFFSQIQQFDIYTYLSNDILYKTDFASMRNSLEVRVPFLDYKIVEFGLSLPWRQKLKNIRNTKHILKSAYKKELPPEILKKNKMGFSVPLASLFRTHFKDLLLSLLETGENPDYINKNYIIKLLCEHNDRKANHKKMLWNILVFLLWYRNNEKK